MRTRAGRQVQRGLRVFVPSSPLGAVLLAVALVTAPAATRLCRRRPRRSAPTILETFTGTLQVNGSNSHPFTVQQVGGVRVSITQIDPSSAVSVGVGTPSTTSGQCLAISSLTAVASPGTQISGTATITGNFCIAVVDVGNLVEPVTYTITVLHS